MPNKKYSLNDVVRIIESWSDDEIIDNDREEVRIAIVPPVEEALTDEDSDLSDSEATGDISHLPSRILRSEAIPDIIIDSKECSADPNSLQDVQQATSSTKYSEINVTKPKWKDGTKFKEPHFIKEPQDRMYFHAMRSNINRPYDCHKFFWDSHIVQLMVDQTNQYAAKNGTTLNVTSDEIHTFIAILIFSGYSKVPSKRHYWSTDPDFANDFIPNAIRRDRFEAILKNFHVVDNANMDDDRFFKVRPLYNHFNEKSKAFPLQDDISIDEAMIAYYGHHPAKQFIRNKPVKYGYKMWCLASSDGYVYHAEPYAGAATQTRDYGLGQGGNVVMDLIDKCSVPSGHKIYFDNLFTSFKLLEKLKESGIGGTGTLRSNRMGDCKLTDSKVIGKKGRGTVESKCSKDVLVIQWVDNKPVIVATNVHPLEPSKIAHRYSRREKIKYPIKMPLPIAKYNQNMGGVDVFDQSVSVYRIRIRSKKWYWALVSWIINATLVNGWRIYQDVINPKIVLLDYIREIVISVIGECGTPNSRPGRRSSNQSGKQNIQRFDERNHWPVNSAIQNGICAMCKRRTKIRCEKCNTALHVDCFRLYHMK